MTVGYIGTLIRINALLVVGWLVVLRINVDLAIFQPYLDLEAGDNQSLKIQVVRPEIEPRSSCSASQELNHSATAAPNVLLVYPQDEKVFGQIEVSILKVIRYSSKNNFKTVSGMAINELTCTLCKMSTYGQTDKTTHYDQLCQDWTQKPFV